MGGGLPAVQRFAAPQPPQQLLPVPHLLLVPGPVLFQFLQKRHDRRLLYLMGTVYHIRGGKGRPNPLGHGGLRLVQKNLSNDSWDLFTVTT